MLQHRGAEALLRFVPVVPSLKEPGQEQYTWAVGSSLLPLFASQREGTTRRRRCIVHSDCYID